MTFKDIPIDISYISVGEDSFSKILNPLLACTKIYKRSVGFFSSSALNFISDGLLEMARNGGKIYLATSPRLSDDDIFAIQNGYADREKIKDAFINDVQSTLKIITDDNARILYMLVKEGIVDVKIVVRNSGIYHDKLALLEDYDGNVIACVGSNNETASGYSGNYEKPVYTRVGLIQKVELRTKCLNLIVYGIMAIHNFLSMISWMHLRKSLYLVLKKVGIIQQPRRNTR